jgi:hypothetical protein
VTTYLAMVLPGVLIPGSIFQTKLLTHKRHPWLLSITISIRQGLYDLVMQIAEIHQTILLRNQFPISLTSETKVQSNQLVIIELLQGVS